MINLVPGKSLLKFDSQLPVYKLALPDEGSGTRQGHSPGALHPGTDPRDRAQERLPVGWIWYVNMMYYLSPETDQRILDDFVTLKYRTTGITDGERSMLPVLQAARS
jgi:hypothetical protein